jgi:hypothetical protein
LREKLVLAQLKYKDQIDDVKKKKAAEASKGNLFDSLSAPSHGKRKDRASDSDPDSDDDQGEHALSLFCKMFKKRVERGLYLDFASVSANRLKEIKMLNSSSTKTTKIAAGLIFKHSLSESDVAVLSEDLLEITSGFTHHYLKVVSESHLENPMDVMVDRLAWWQWVSKCFVLG